MGKKIVVLTYGTFDVLHFGHFRLLKRARALGDYLIVALSSDEFNLTEKSKKALISYENRKKALEELPFVDSVIPEKNWEQKTTDVLKYEVDIFVMGDDWKGKFDDAIPHPCKVIYLPRTGEISTTELKSSMMKEYFYYLMQHLPPTSCEDFFKIIAEKYSITKKNLDDYYATLPK